MHATEGAETAMERDIAAMARSIADSLNTVLFFTNLFYVIVFYNLRGSVMYTYYR